jgi:hypothetical protein
VISLQSAKEFTIRFRSYTSVETKRGRQRGGMIPGAGSGDTFSAMLEPGEGVLNRNAVAGLGGPSFVSWANASWPRFQAGGIMPSPGHVPNKFGGRVSLPHRRNREKMAHYFARLRPAIDRAVERDTGIADFWIDVGNRVADRRQTIRDDDGTLTSAEAAARKADLLILIKMLTRKRRYTVDAGKWSRQLRYGAKSTELAREARFLLEDIRDLQLERSGVVPTPPGEEPGAGGGAGSFADVFRGFLSSFAPNIFHPTAGGLAFGSAPLGGSGGGTTRPTSGASAAAGSRRVTVNQFFHQPPEDPHPLMRSADFAAKAAFGD